MPASVIKYGVRSAEETGESGTYDFVLSDETTDRVGDIIEVDGWKLSAFKKNPVALYGHDNSRLPIGKWERVRIEGKKLLGRLRLAPEGTNAFTDSVRKLLDLRMLNACSVGFHTIKAAPLDPENPWNGYRFIEQELLECSVVTVPANPNAVLQRALSEFPTEVRQLLLANRGPVQLPAPTTHVKRDTTQPPNAGGKAMAKLAELIQQDRDEILTIRDAQAPFFKKISEGEELDETETQEFDRLGTELAGIEKRLAMREQTEKALGQSSAARNNTSLAAPAVIGNGKAAPLATAKKERPLDLLIKMQVVHLKAFVERKPLDVMAREIYPDRQDMEAVTKAVTNPAQTTVAGWAAELVEVGVADFLDALRPASVYGQLSAMGPRFSFGRNGQLKIPRRNSGTGAAPDLRGAFVGEGQPIPVRRGSFGAVTLVPHKMGVISTFTKEMAQYSTPAIEGLIREGIIEDTAVAIDTALLDAVAGDAIRPAGLGNGVTPIAGAAGGDIDAVTADIAAAIAPFITANAADRLVWLANPGQIFKLQWLASPIGTYPFRDQAAAGNLGGYPVIPSTTIPATELWLVRYADFISSTADTPEFDVSDVATIHEDDGSYPADQAMRPGTSTVLPIVGGAGTAAQPVRSLWQTASIGIRMLMGMDWAMRRAGMVSKVTGITW